MQLVYTTTDGREAALVPPSEDLLLEVGALHMRDDGGHWRQIAYYGERSAWELEPDVSHPGLAEPAADQASLWVRAVQPLELWVLGDHFDDLLDKGSELELRTADDEITLHLDGAKVAWWQAWAQDDVIDDFWRDSRGQKLMGKILIRVDAARAAPETAPLGPRHRLSALAGRPRTLAPRADG